MKEKYEPENVALEDVRIVKALEFVSLRITKLFYGSEPQGCSPQCANVPKLTWTLFSGWIRNEQGKCSKMGLPADKLYRLDC